VRLPRSERLDARRRVQAVVARAVAAGLEVAVEIEKATSLLLMSARRFGYCPPIRR